MSIPVTPDAVEARRAYQRQWRKDNPDKVREHNRRYWQKKAREALKSRTEIQVMQVKSL